MARQVINIGVDPNDGSGDTIRDSFDKVNDNFAEVYANITALSDGNVTTDIKGNVFGEDSTLLVDGVNGVIPASVLDGTVSRDNIPIEYLRLPDPETLVFPPTPTSSGTKGEVVYSGGYIYVCVATNTWVRSAVETAWG